VDPNLVQAHSPGHLEQEEGQDPSPDNREGDPDQKFIRVETCMFMIKLPRYTTYEIMREKLLYAISCSLDPLSG